MVAKCCCLLVAVLAGGAAAHGGGPGSETGGISSLLREIEGGGRIRNFLHRYLLKGLEKVTVGSAKGPVTSDSAGVQEQTFISPPLTLRNGEIANKWLPIDWPEGHILVKSFSADLLHVGPGGAVPPVTPCCGGPFEAPRSTSFLHHWTVNKWQVTSSFLRELVKKGGEEFSANIDSAGIETIIADAGLNDGANGPCWDSELHVFFGIGNEVRGKPAGGKHEAYEFRDPYGVEFNMDSMRQVGETMVLNTHLIDLRNVTDRRACVECKCSYLNTTGSGPLITGGLSCCHSTAINGAKCPIEEGVEASETTYYIRYTVKWRDFDPASSAPLEVITFDATDDNRKWGDFPFVPGGYAEQHVALKKDPASMAVVKDQRSGVYDGHGACHVEYYVPSCPRGGDCIQRLRNSWELPYPAEIVFVRHHFHIGGANATLRSDQGLICTGLPTYDETGLITDINTCAPPATRLERGQRIYSEFLYKQDELPHYGAMAMSFVYVHVPRERQAKPDVLQAKPDVLQAKPDVLV